MGDAILNLPDVENCMGEYRVEYDKSPKTDYQKVMRIKSRNVYNHVYRCTSERNLNVFKALKLGQWNKNLPQEIKDLLPF